MAYSDFDLKTAVQSFGLTEERDTDLFAAVPPLEPNEYLRAWLDEFARVAVGINTEQARREFIVAPVLAEAKRRAVGPVTVHPGVALDVDRGRGLSGFCDYIIARSPEYYYLRSPLVAVVEAKREDVVAGFGQCAAAMVGVREFNEKDGTPVPAVYGAVTSGNLWRFLRLAGSTLAIDRPEYSLRDTPKLLGILVHLAGGG